MTERAWRAWLSSIGLVALLVRSLHLVQIRDIGFFRQPVSDAAVYVRRASEIAAGDWVGPADFVHAPLYAYLLAVVRMVAGPDLLWPRVTQIALGTGACLVLMAAARRWLDSAVAVAAGLLLALCPVAVFFDGLIQKTSLVLFLSTVLLLLLAPSRAARRWWTGWGSVGVTLGLLILTRQNALALVPLVFLVLLWRAREAPGRRAATAVRAGTALLLGLLVTLAPWAARNRAVIGDFVLTTPNLGQNFAMGNDPDGTGTYAAPARGRGSGDLEQRAWTRAAERAVGRGLTPAEVSDHHLDGALRAIRDQPARWAALMWRKWLMVWGRYELPDTEDFYLYADRAALLRVLDALLNVGVLCPLAALGIVLTGSRWRRLWPLYAWLGLVALGVAAFVVLGRYRMPNVPVLAMLAGAGIVESARLARARRPGLLAAGAAAAAAAAAACNLPLQPIGPRSFAWTNHAVALADGGRLEEALVEVERALTATPDDVDALWVRGSILVDLGRAAEARACYRRAVELDPEAAVAWRGLGYALLLDEHPVEAEAAYRRALALDPRDELALTHGAAAVSMQGRLPEAAGMLRRALEIDPDLFEAHLNLGNVLLSQGRLEAAASSYERALDLRPDHADTLHNLGTAEALAGRYGPAIDRYEAALRLQPDRPDTRAALDAARRAAGDGKP